MTYEEEQAMIEANDSGVYTRDASWWPTEKEVDEILAENMESAYDFVMWVADTCNRPETNEQKVVLDKLNNLLYERVQFLDENAAPPRFDDSLEIFAKDVDMDMIRSIMLKKRFAGEKIPVGRLEERRLKREYEDRVFFREDWWPTREEVGILADNIASTYDFIYWFVHTVTYPINDEKRKILALLNGVLDTHVTFESRMKDRDENPLRRDLIDSLHLEELGLLYTKEEEDPEEAADVTPRTRGRKTKKTTESNSKKK